MKPILQRTQTLRWIISFIVRALGALFLITSASCNFLSSEDESLKDTQTALAVQQTVVAQQGSGDVNATIEAQQATIDAQNAQATAIAGQPPPPPTPDMAATQGAVAAEQTAMAQQGAPAETQPPMPPPDQPPPADIEAKMRTANILLYEDVINDPKKKRYVQDTLKAMGLNFKDDGSAKGWLKSDLLGSAPGGSPWDLVILAIEERGEVSGEYFEYLQNVINQGTPVIVEAWHLDAISEGKVSPILAKCGVGVYPFFPKTFTINDIVMWPLGVPHPVINDPNSGLTFTKVLDTWLWQGDLGSQMFLTGGGDAQLLLGTNASEPFQDGTLAVCMGGQLTLQTFSSHSFNWDTMYRLWENYITNALRFRFAGG